MQFITRQYNPALQNGSSQIIQLRGHKKYRIRAVSCYATADVAENDVVLQVAGAAGVPFTDLRWSIPAVAPISNDSFLLWALNLPPYTYNVPHNAYMAGVPLPDLWWEDDLDIIVETPFTLNTPPYYWVDCAV